MKQEIQQNDTRIIQIVSFAKNSGFMNKYNSLIIDFKKIKVTKIQSTSVMNLNSEKKKRMKKYVVNYFFLKLFE